MKYLVKLRSSEDRKYLENVGKVGNPQSLPEYVIFETDLTIDEIKAFTFVEEVELEEEAEPLDAGWATPWISNSPTYRNDNTGKGVDIYIIDSGVRDTHEELIGRVETIYTYDDVNYSTTVGVSPSHGTAVAGCAAGTKYGTAPEANIISCRIDFGTGTILKALDSILKHHLEKPDDRPSILNVSLATTSSIIASLFDKLTRYGIVIVAAAGNSSEPEPRYPARSIWIEAVGALNSSDKPSYFTNKGADVYAPGTNVTTASVFADNVPMVTSGTSFAAPYYAGLLACLLEGSDKFNTNLHVSRFLKEMREIIMQTGRIPDFDNSGKVIRTATSNSLGSVYYVNPLKSVPDDVIRAWLVENANNPQLIADNAREFNLSFDRLVRIAGPEYTEEQLRYYFVVSRVTPWWV